MAIVLTLRATVLIFLLHSLSPPSLENETISVANSKIQLFKYLLGTQFVLYSGTTIMKITVPEIKVLAVVEGKHVPRDAPWLESI